MSLANQPGTDGARSGSQSLLTGGYEIADVEVRTIDRLFGRLYIIYMSLLGALLFLKPLQVWAEHPDFAWSTILIDGFKRRITNSSFLFLLVLAITFFPTVRARLFESLELIRSKIGYSATHALLHFLIGIVTIVYLVAMSARGETFNWTPGGPVAYLRTVATIQRCEGAIVLLQIFTLSAELALLALIQRPTSSRRIVGWVETYTNDGVFCWIKAGSEVFVKVNLPFLFFARSQPTPQTPFEIPAGSSSARVITQDGERSEIIESRSSLEKRALAKSERDRDQDEELRSLQEEYTQFLRNRAWLKDESD